MKVITLPVRVVVRLVVLPIKLVLATAGLTFKAGLKAGALPFKGGIAATRVLGFRAIVLFALGLVGGVALARRFGLVGSDPTGAPLGASVSGNGSGGGSTSGPAATTALVVEDTVVVEEGPAGTIVTETLTVDEVSIGSTPVHNDGSPLEQVRGADSEEDAERVVDIDAEVAEALGETPGEHA